MSDVYNAPKAERETSRLPGQKSPGAIEEASSFRSGPEARASLAMLDEQGSKGLDRNKVPEVKSSKELADDIMAAHKAYAANPDAKPNPLEDPQLVRSLIAKFQDAYAKGGMAELREAEDQINRDIDGNFGPVVAEKVHGNTRTPVLRICEQDKTTGRLTDIAKWVDFSYREAAEAQERPGVDGKIGDKDKAPLGSAYGLAQGLQSLEQQLHGKFLPDNPTQQQVVEWQQKLAGELNKIPKSVLDSLGSNDVTKLNQFLKAHGYDIQLEPLGPNGVGVVTSMQLEGKWDGKDGYKIDSNGQNYPAFKLKTNSIYQVDGHKDPVMKIYEDREAGLSAYVTPYDGNASQLQATEAARRLTPAGTEPNPERYNAVILPKVDMNRSVKLDWLLGLKNESGHTIDQALAQTMVQMDHNGFKVKEGLALGASKGIDLDHPYRVEKPFLFWVQKEGMRYPLVATRINQQYWRDPNPR